MSTNHPKHASRRRFIAAAGAASLTLAAPALVRAQGRQAGQGLGRPAAVRGGQLAGHAVHDRQQDLRALRGGSRLRPDRRLSRLSVRAADGRSVRVEEPRLRHVGQHADRAPDRAEAADPAPHRRRRPFPLRARDAQGFADPQHRRPQGQDRRRAAGRRSVQRADADAALRARQSRSARVQHHRRQHADAGAGGDDSRPAWTQRC